MKNNIRIFSINVLLVCGFLPVKAQLLDTIATSLHSKPKFFFQIDAYNSFVSKESANTFGFKAGLEFNKRIRIGVGYYSLTSNIVKQKIIPGVLIQDTIVDAQLDMNFIPVSLEYIFYNKEPWQISIPLNIGAGKSYFWYYKKNTNGERGKVDEKTVALLTLSVEAQYKIIKWFGVGGGLGFRVMLKDISNINENFNSVIYNVGLRIFVDEIFKSIFRKGN